MQRARRSILSVVVLALALVGIAGVTPNPVRLVAPAAAVSWPTSGGLVIGEVMTGGVSASDEYVELFNGGSTTLDLQNVELVYISAAGTTPTRKASWTASRPLAPGQHLLIANTAGVFAPTADAAYSSGIAATGGAVAVRVIGGAVIDAAGWGDAFVHGTGHGVGLEIHELPRVTSSSDGTLAAGHVVTVEPGVYLAEHGGVRIEDTVVVTPDGCRPLTHAPKAPVVC